MDWLNKMVAYDGWSEGTHRLVAYNGWFQLVEIVWLHTTFRLNNSLLLLLLLRSNGSRK